MRSMSPAKKPAKKGKKYARKSNATRVDVYERVTTAITDALDAGVTPWHKPWASRSGAEPFTPKNAVTGRPYRGINVFLLYVSAATHGYEDPRWLTFKQAAARAKTVWLKANGHTDDDAGNAAFIEAVAGVRDADGNLTKEPTYHCGVRKDEKSTPVTLWKPSVREIDDPDKPGEKKKVPSLFLKEFNVFNVEQCDGLDLVSIVPEPDDEPEEFDYIAAAESLVEEMPKRPVMFKGGNSAHYSPLADTVTLPDATDFESPEAFYATAFHELAHATGHESRTGRVKYWTGGFGSEPYAQEELVAEMASAFLCAMVGIDSRLDESAAYIGNWSGAIKAATKADKRWLVMAASRAQKAADWIIGEHADEPTPTNGEAV